MKSFKTEYASVYDDMYASKDYEAESTALVKLLQTRGISPGARLLDYGCGTGRHMACLIDLGYEVIGVDASPDMLRIASARLAERALVMTPQQFAQCDTAFDAAFSLFDVFSYQVSAPALESFLESLCRNVRPSGAIVVDGWHLPGMIRQPPEARSTTVVSTDGRRIVRRVEPRVDWLNSRVDLRITLLQEGDTSNGVTSIESHHLRGFTHLELQLLARQQELSDISIQRSVGDPSPVCESDWHFTMLARKE